RDYKVTGVQTCALPISRHQYDLLDVSLLQPRDRAGGVGPLPRLGGRCRHGRDSASRPPPAAEYAGQWVLRLLDNDAGWRRNSERVGRWRKGHVKQFYTVRTAVLDANPPQAHYLATACPGEIGRASCRERV